MEELWKDIPGYSGMYQVSNLGRVRSFHKWNDGKSCRILRQSKSAKGYMFVDLLGDTRRVHRLVATCFLPNPNGHTQVNHINENKADNRSDNLEWCSAKYNMNYGHRKENQVKKLSKPVICVETRTTYASAAQAARETNLRQGNITLCCQHKNRSAGGYHWEYA